MALRYLKGAEGQSEGRSFLKFVTYVAVGGVALGVAALLLSLAIVRGFSQEITNKIIGFGSHIQVRSYFQDEPLPGAAALKDQLSSTAGVRRVLPVVEGLVLLRQSERSIDGVQLLGTTEPPPYLSQHVKRGAFRLERGDDGRPALVVGASLADRMGIEVGP